MQKLLILIFKLFFNQDIGSFKQNLKKSSKLKKKRNYNLILKFRIKLNFGWKLKSIKNNSEWKINKLVLSIFFKKKLILKTNLKLKIEAYPQFSFFYP